MKGEKELIEKILNTEINIFLSIRDGSALMQHMEDFYYISLLEVLAVLNYMLCHFSKGIILFIFFGFCSLTECEIKLPNGCEITNG